jgi:hypothetical protein
MSGYENLTGQQRGKLSIGDRASSAPLKWSVRCAICGSSWNEHHATLVQSANPLCRNAGCGRVSERAGTLARVDVIPTGVRSSDSASARRFASEQRPRQSVTRPLTTQEMLNADPATLARAIAHERKK